MGRLHLFMHDEYERWKLVESCTTHYFPLKKKESRFTIHRLQKSVKTKG